jgi:N-formylglutamate amidohydrolase
VSEIFTFHRGPGPLLVSVPHDGREVPAAIRERMTEAGRELPDTDWHVARLYDFVHELDASLLVANYSRYVIDLNRPASDATLYPGQVATGLCPGQTFAGEDIYETGNVDAHDRQWRIDRYWRPYHEQIETALTAIKKQYGFALLWDAHSIPSRVPRLFDGELTELNVGTFGGKSSAPAIEAGIMAAVASSPFEAVLNGRFQGGFITRRYGDPAACVHAVQLEIAQRVYMDEPGRAYDVEKASRLRDTLRHVLEIFIKLGEKG